MSTCGLSGEVDGLGRRANAMVESPHCARLGGMEKGIWRPMDFATETAWLGGVESIGAALGFDPDGWEASIWIAHAMYELPGVDVDCTHDDAHKARLAAGIEEPTIIGSRVGLGGESFSCSGTKPDGCRICFARPACAGTRRSLSDPTRRVATWIRANRRSC